VLDCAVLDLPSIAETVGLSVEEVAGELEILEETEEEYIMETPLNLEEILHVPIGTLERHMEPDDLREYIRIAVERGIQTGRQQAADAMNAALKKEQLKYYYPEAS
jgi:hypothetical protein